MNCWPSGKYVHLLYMYSILGRGSFCFNYCLNSAWHGGDQFVALLRWYGSPGFFDSGLQNTIQQGKAKRDNPGMRAIIQAGANTIRNSKAKG